MLKQKSQNHLTMEETEKLIEETWKYERKLYQALEGKPLTVDTLAEAISPFMPRSIQDKLVDYCQLLLQGVQEGEQTAEKLINSGNSSAEAQIIAAMERIPMENYKDFLLQLYRVLSNKQNRSVPSNTMLYLENQTTEQLIKINAKLLDAQSQIDAARLLDEFSHFLNWNDPKQNEELRSLRETYTPIDSLWISAASIYVAAAHSNLVNCEMVLEEPLEIGRKTGFMNQFWEGISSRALEVAAGLGSIAAGACMWAAVLLKGYVVMDAVEAFLMGTGLFATDSLIPCVLTAIPVSLGIVAVITAGAMLAGLGVMLLMNEFSSETAAVTINNDMNDIDAQARQYLNYAVPTAAGNLSDEYVTDNDDQCLDIWDENYDVNLET